MKKLALITGSKGGIGSAISSKLVEQGYRVIATYFTGALLIKSGKERSSPTELAC